MHCIFQSSAILCCAEAMRCSPTAPLDIKARRCTSPVAVPRQPLLTMTPMPSQRCRQSATTRRIAKHRDNMPLPTVQSPRQCYDSLIPPCRSLAAAARRWPQSSALLALFMGRSGKMVAGGSRRSDLEIAPFDLSLRCNLIPRRPEPPLCTILFSLDSSKGMG